MSLFSPYHVRRLSYICVLLIILYITIQSLRPHPELITDRAAQLQQIDRYIKSSNSNPEVWRGRQACKHPPLDVKSPEMMKFVKDEGPIKCSAEKDWVEVIGSTATITSEAKKKYGEIECSFTDILRTNDFTTQVGITTSTHTEYNLEASDFVRVRCFGESGKRWSSILSGIRHDQDVLDRTGWHLIPPAALKLNVLIFGFDSLSKNTFIRKLPKSYDYVKKQLNGIVLEGYNIVGDGTPQALIPILTGKTELELPDTRRRMGSKAVHVNVYPFIWNNFRDNGYVTAYMEDTPSVGIFTYRLKGFDKVPTDHYMRPFFVEAEPDYSRHNKYCLGSLPRHKIMLDYAKHMYRVYSERPKFIFGFHGEISHDSYNLVGAADDDLMEWLDWFKTEGHLNNTLLVLMSDHGHRFAEIRNTQQGKLEERLPWFSLIFPPWFESAYPEAMANLKINAHRLSTPFDVYPTLASVLQPPPFVKGNLSHRSISLLQEIPAERTCADAYIEPHWCACLDWESVDRNDPVVIGAARSFINKINKYNSKYTDECSKLELSEVLWAARLVPSGALRKFRSSKDADGFVADLTGDTQVTRVVYQVKLIATPGEGIFEASLSYDISQEEYFLKVEDVSRINQYGSQARCIENTQEQLRKFCYCKES